MDARRGVDRTLGAPEDGARASVALEGKSLVGSTTDDILVTPCSILLCLVTGRGPFMLSKHAQMSY